MPWVRFTADMDWKPKPAVTIAYKAGMVRLVTRACAAKATDAGKAEKTERPSNDGRKT
ncbi:hypothetical protein EVB67_075 [Rhizobium phage RHph_TM3_3_14B]|nr:hypothetical protein EVB67_075 [Rhizobium phage RHph_TM3_3_14B]